MEKYKIRFTMKVRGNTIGLIETPQNKDFLNELGKLVGNDFVILKQNEEDDLKNIKSFKALVSLKGGIFIDG